MTETSTLTLKDVAERLQVTTYTARRYMNSMPGVIRLAGHNGGRGPIRIKEKDFDSWLNSMMVAPTAPTKRPRGRKAHIPMRK